MTKKALRVALVVPAAQRGPYPDKQVNNLVLRGEVDLVVFPEADFGGETRDDIVAGARGAAEALGLPVLRGGWCFREEMQCAGYWNPSAARSETRSHFYAKHATSTRLAYQLGDYDAIRAEMFTPIRLAGRNLAVQLCHDMFFGLVSARWKANGADTFFDLTGDSVNRSKWTNVLAARSLEHGVPFLCTMARKPRSTNKADAFGFRVGRPIEATKRYDSVRNGSVVVLDVDGALMDGETENAGQAFTEKAYDDITVALGNPRATAAVHVGFDGALDIAPRARAMGWSSKTMACGEVGIASLPLSALRDPLAIHRLEGEATPFDHHVVVFTSARDDMSLEHAMTLAKMRAIEHRMAVGVLSPSIREMVKTNRYKNVQRFRERDGVFGLDATFLGGTYGAASEKAGNGVLGVPREFIGKYRELVEGLGVPVDRESGVRQAEGPGGRSGGARVPGRRSG